MRAMCATVLIVIGGLIGLLLLASGGSLAGAIVAASLVIGGALIAGSPNAEQKSAKALTDGELPIPGQAIADELRDIESRVDKVVGGVALCHSRLDAVRLVSEVGFRRGGLFGSMSAETRETREKRIWRFCSELAEALGARLLSVGQQIDSELAPIDGKQKLRSRQICDQVQRIEKRVQAVKGELEHYHGEPAIRVAAELQGAQRSLALAYGTLVGNEDLYGPDAAKELEAVGQRLSVVIQSFPCDPASAAIHRATALIHVEEADSRLLLAVGNLDVAAKHS